MGIQGPLGIAARGAVRGGIEAGPPGWDAVGRSVLTIVLSGLLALVGAALGRQTVTPLVDFRAKTERMEAGDLNVDFSSDRADEIGRLYGSCAQMRDSLREQIREARSAREEAEVAREEVTAGSEEVQSASQRVSESVQAISEGAERQNEQFQAVSAEGFDFDHFGDRDG